MSSRNIEFSKSGKNKRFRSREGSGRLRTIIPKSSAGVLPATARNPIAVDPDNRCLCARPNVSVKSGRQQWRLYGGHPVANTLECQRWAFL
jgi:hypothetical protein